MFLFLLVWKIGIESMLPAISNYRWCRIANPLYRICYPLGQKQREGERNTALSTPSLIIHSSHKCQAWLLSGYLFRYQLVGTALCSHQVWFQFTHRGHWWRWPHWPSCCSDKNQAKSKALRPEVPLPHMVWESNEPKVAWLVCPSMHDLDMRRSCLVGRWEILESLFLHLVYL